MKRFPPDLHYQYVEDIAPIAVSHSLGPHPSEPLGRVLTDAGADGGKRLRHFMIFLSLTRPR